MKVVHRCINREDMWQEMQDHKCCDQAPAFMRSEAPSEDYIEMVCEHCGDTFKRRRSNEEPPDFYSPIYVPQKWQLPRWKIADRDALLAKMEIQKEEDRKIFEAICASIHDPDDTVVSSRPFDMPARTMLPDFSSIGRKLLMVDELPQGALPHYERDVRETAFVKGK